MSQAGKTAFQDGLRLWAGAMLFFLAMMGGCSSWKKCPNQDVITNMQIWVWLHGPLELPVPGELGPLRPSLPLE